MKDATIYRVLVLYEKKYLELPAAMLTHGGGNINGLCYYGKQYERKQQILCQIK